MIFAKDGVQPKSLIIACAIANVLELWKRSGTLTAGRNGTHKAGSLHDSDRALDFRSKDFHSLEAKLEFLREVLTRLGRSEVVSLAWTNGTGFACGDYQGALEYEGQPQEHFHVEHDPADH